MRRRMLFLLTVVLAFSTMGCGAQSEETKSAEADTSVPALAAESQFSPPPTTVPESIDPYSRAADSSEPPEEFDDYDPYDDPYYNPTGLGGLSAYSDTTQDDDAFVWQTMYYDYTHEDGMSDDRLAYRIHCVRNTSTTFGGSIAYAERFMFNLPDDASIATRGASVQWVNRAGYNTTIIAKASNLGGTVFQVNYAGDLPVSVNDMITVFGSLAYGGGSYSVTDQYNRTTEYQCIAIDCRDIIINNDYHISVKEFNRVGGYPGAPQFTDLELDYWLNRSYDDNGTIYTVTPTSINGHKFTINSWIRNVATGDMMLQVRYDDMAYNDGNYTYICMEWDRLRIETSGYDYSNPPAKSVIKNAEWFTRWDVV